MFPHPNIPNLNGLVMTTFIPITITGGGSGAGLGTFTHITGFGSSSTANTSLYSIASNNRAFYGESYIHWALKMLGQPTGYVRDMRSGAEGGQGQYRYGQTGGFLSAMLTNGMGSECVTACKAAGKGLIIAQPDRNGIGNLNPAQDILARCETLILSAQSNGIPIMMMQDFPRLSAGAGPDESLVLPIRQAVNSGLVTLCQQYNVPLALVGSIGELASTPGYSDPTLFDTTRPGHPKIPVAYLMGKEIVRVLSASFSVPPPVNIYSRFSEAINTHLNPQLTGTGGPGGRPDYWTTGNNGASTQVRSVTAYNDGTTRNWFRLSAIHNGGNGSVQFSLNHPLTSNFVAGDMLEAWCEVRFPNASSWEGGGVDFNILFQPSFNQPFDGFNKFNYDSPPKIFERPDGILVMRTPPCSAPVGTTTVGMTLRFYGGGVVDFGTPLIFKNNVNLPQHYPVPIG